MLANTVLEMREEAEFWISRARGSTASVSATVVIPTFNAEGTLLRAVRSALNQTLRDIEVIIVDDASTDSSWRLITALLSEDPRVRAIRHKKNDGKPTAMNRAIAVAQGRWLAVLDADDWYHRDRLSALIALAEQGQSDMVADNQFLYDARADHLVCSAWPRKETAWELTFDDFLMGSDAYENFNLGMLKPILRVDFMRRMGKAYEEKARQGEDFLHLLQFYLAGGRAIVCDTPYYYYTQPFGSISRQWSQPTRTRYDFQIAYDLNQRHLDEATPILTRRQRALLEARNRSLRVLETYFRARDAIARRDWLTATTLLAGHPAAMTYLIRRLGRRFRPDPTSRTIDNIAIRSRRRTAFNTASSPSGNSDA